MRFHNCWWRGMVGIIKPTKGSGSLVELIKMLPDGIGVIALFNNVRHGKIEEFHAAVPVCRKDCRLIERGREFILNLG